MWINSTPRAEPYLALTSWESSRNGGVPFGEPSDRCCMAVVSSCREMLGYVPQRAQPLPLVASIKLGTLEGLPVSSRRKVGTTSSPHGPYGQGFTRATMAGTEGSEAERWSQSQKNRSQFGLESATRLHEVGIASNRESACRGEYVPGPCTHRPSHHGSWLDQKSLC